MSNTKIIRSLPGNIVFCYALFYFKPLKKNFLFCFATTSSIMAVMYAEITELRFNYFIFIFHKITNAKALNTPYISRSLSRGDPII